MKPVVAIVAVAVIAVLLVFSGAFYTVHETKIAILTQFGKPIGEPITESGLHWKTPFVQEVIYLDKRALEFDAPSTQMSTKDKTYIEVDTFGRWRINDPAKFFVSVRDERSAQSRLEDIIGSEVRTAVASNELLEVIRSDKNRVLTTESQQQGGVPITLPSVLRGRLDIEMDVLNQAKPKLLPLGIELLDVRIKRVNYNRDVLQNIYRRMTSERMQIAQRFRSEGEGEAARINGKRERDLREIESTAYKQVQQIRGEADAEATRVYAAAYDQSPESREFYTFQKTMETYRTVLAGTNLVLSTDSELFKLLKQAH